MNENDKRSRVPSQDDDEEDDEDEDIPGGDEFFVTLLLFETFFSFCPCCRNLLHWTSTRNKRCSNCNATLLRDKLKQNVALLAFMKYCNVQMFHCYFSFLFKEELKLDYVDEKTGEIPSSRYQVFPCLVSVMITCNIQE